MAKHELTAERLRELLHYDPDTGIFTWVNDAGSGGRIKSGSIAGGRAKDGYVKIHVDGKQYLAHRLAWLYMTGSWPAADIDHRYGILDDNRWHEIRSVTHQHNLQNQRKARVDNRCGLLGVSIYKGRPRAKIKVNGKQVHLGYFKTPELAHSAYLEAKALFHPLQTIAVC